MVFDACHIIQAKQVLHYGLQAYPYVSMEHLYALELGPFMQTIESVENSKKNNTHKAVGTYQVISMEHIENLMKIGYRQRAYDAEEWKIAADIVRVCVCIGCCTVHIVCTAL